jgi:hypothetical protein
MPFTIAVVKPVIAEAIPLFSTFPIMPNAETVPVIPVWARTAKPAAAPRDGEVAAKVATGPIRPNTKETIIVNIELLLKFFIYLYYLLIINFFKKMPKQGISELQEPLRYKMQFYVCLNYFNLLFLLFK